MDKMHEQKPISIIPGYTGHIPHKMNTFGMTVGEINRQLILKEKSDSNHPLSFFSSKKPVFLYNIDKRKYGFNSLKAENWIGGSTVKLFPQHIPG